MPRRWLGLALLALAAPAHAAPLNPAAGWAISYLMNAAFVAEHAAARAAAPDAAAFDASEAGRALRTRAEFAVAEARTRSQRLMDAPVPVPVPVPAPSTTDVTRSFPPGDPRAAQWDTLAPAFAAPSPTCAIDASDVRAFLQRQNDLAAGGKAPPAQALLTSIERWELPKVQCLLFALMATEGAEPLHLMRALQQTASPFAADASVRALLAVRYLQLAEYPEALRALMDLTDVDPAFRLPYDAVQRVFGLRQKGEGAVALRGP